ncbi:saccharopine dehydrogenase family protein [Sediminispirochaeta smaragdinae]|uniref:Saccharopine dehydrogenase n=1 Tax=Sediminispirochaeta smaragdinae (strain DSM 11293 / JCM 15392 / SEBR 4228) TaxID=573413 RepID=E1RCG2_SEDSS|nr:saccharopine dehydrogenase family protein [Sediminispirochaeta smaragdinae]ADK80042.1 Saccharopine dehydrogenase [Sediminispirochaeta smaragdinae DSM 11293]
MNRVLIIGAGGVGRVVAHKCAQLPETFHSIMLASRTKAKCDQIAEELPRAIETARVDADNVSELAALMRSYKPDLVINVALPYQDLTIMDACLEVGVHYLDTANYEPKEVAKFEYSWQWAYQDKFEKAGLMALLGSGFDPGVTNVFTAYLARHQFDELEEIEIVDVNGGDHGKPFATNFNPEINIREVTASCRHWESGRFIETPPMSASKAFTCPEGVGTYTIYRLYHEELESLIKHIPSLKKAQFWMSFSENYLKHLEVLQNVGMTSIEPVDYKGTKIIPLQFLKAVLPEPASLGPDTKGETCIGVIGRGRKEGKSREAYIYNICSHEAAYEETNSQGVSYTTGVPAMVGAKMMIEGKWSGKGVYNMEQFDPDPFLDDLARYGLPWKLTISD